MKYLSKIAGSSLLILSFIFVNACKKDKPTPPVVNTAPVSEVSYTTATSGGEATNEGGMPILSKGVCWNTSPDPTISNNKTTESGGLGSFSSSLTQLLSNTTYYVRAYATNSAGTGYGNQITFTTNQIGVPVLTTTIISTVGQTTATSGGNITDDKGGNVTSRGVCWSKSENPTIADNKTIDGTSTGSFVSSLTGLSGNTLYYIRAYATNSAGTQYGNQVTFTTNPVIATLTTVTATSKALTAGTGGGNITSDGGSPITARGVCWSLAINPNTENSKTIDGSGTGVYTSTMNGLIANTTYYVRAYAINNIGTAYGNESVFKTCALTDIDGNAYHYVALGNQFWLVENLKTTKYNDGTLIVEVTDDLAWSSLRTDAYCWYNNDSNNKDPYGALYNWFVIDKAMYGNKNVCPVGWHLPTKAEWAAMFDYLSLNGYGYGGNTDQTAKSIAAASGWENDPTPGNVGNDQNANNSSGFNGLPAGLRNDGTSFGALGRHTGWWAVPDDYGLGYSYWANSIWSSTKTIWRGASTWTTGLSIRCVKN